MWNLHNTELYISWHINRQQETLWKQRVNYFHFALWRLLSESILYIVIKEHYANCYHGTQYKIVNIAYVRVRVNLYLLLTPKYIMYK